MGIFTMYPTCPTSDYNRYFFCTIQVSIKNPSTSQRSSSESDQVRRKTGLFSLHHHHHQKSAAITHDVVV